MKTGRAAMWANLKVGGALLLALGLAAGCGKTGTTESGETHFVSCDTNSDCAGVTNAHTCSGGFCRGPGNDGAPSSKAPACEDGCGGSECATPGTCTLAAACAVAGCGTANVDDNACVRPSCNDDSGCPDDERCTAVWLGRHYDCVQKGTSCECGVGLGLFPITVCSPVSLVGRRGEWAVVSMIQNFSDRTEVHDFYPDGRVTTFISADSGPVNRDAQLSGEELDELNLVIDGPTLRPQIPDRLTCSLPDEVVGLTIGFDPDFQDAVNGCFEPTDTDIATLLTLARKY